MLIGVIADDLTGATDVALMLSRAGMSVVQTVGPPIAGQSLPEADAIVIALKSRTIAPAEAVAMSLAAARALKAGGARQILFKVCSTFDSTDAGNIGPVAAALAQELGARAVIVCPAFPATGRTVYQGHLFVGSALLSDSAMKDHPLTPMRDANLVRVLARQTSVPVHLAPIPLVRGAPETLRAWLQERGADGPAFVVADAIDDDDLRLLGAAVAGAPLVTGGSGIALGLAANLADERTARGTQHTSGLEAPAFEAPEGPAAILSGSCSQATQAQVAAAQGAGVPAFRLDPHAIASGAMTPAMIGAWARPRLPAGPVLIYSTDAPDAVAAIQSALGRDAAGHAMEQAMGDIACLLAAAGVRRFVVAGGETSGAVVQALGVTALRIGPEIDPGVPWTLSIGQPSLALALKSGNFGAQDFFLKALRLLDK